MHCSQHTGDMMLYAGGHGWVGLAAPGHFPGTQRYIMLKKGNLAISSAIPLLQEGFLR